MLDAIKTKMFIIIVDNIQIEVQKKKIKNMTLRVCAPHGVVKISAPLRSSNKMIRHFAETHIAWIRKKQSAYQSIHQESSYSYITGERHLLEGQEYTLRVHEGIKQTKTYMNDDEHIDLFVPHASTLDYRKKMLMQFYRQKLISQLEILIPVWEQRIGVQAEHYQARVMKSRWGSCHPRNRKIVLNLALIKYPRICLEYVIVHELVHLLEPSHNFRFKAFMDEFMPDWRTHKASLNAGHFMSDN